MPTYEYSCKNCSHRLEKLQKMSDEPLKHCPKCQKETLQRIPGRGIGLSFVGSGFYINDYARKSPAKEGGCCPCGKNQPSCESK